MGIERYVLPVIAYLSRHKEVGQFLGLTQLSQSEFRGEELNSTASVSQVYHSLNAQRMCSIRANGDCCWLIFELHFFAGSVECICGSFEQSLRVANVGSVKRIGSMTT